MLPVFPSWAKKYMGALDKQGQTLRYEKDMTRGKAEAEIQTPVDKHSRRLTEMSCSKLVQATEVDREEDEARRANEVGDKPSRVKEWEDQKKPGYYTRATVFIITKGEKFRCRQRLGLAQMEEQMQVCRGGKKPKLPLQGQDVCATHLFSLVLF